MPTTITLEGSDAGGATLSYRIIQTPGHGSILDIAGSSCTYRSAEGFFGTDQFTYEVSNGTLTASAVVTIEVARNQGEVDLITGAWTPSSISPNGPCDEVTMTPDGQIVVFSSYATNLVHGTSADRKRIFIYDKGTKRLTCASYAYDGSDPNGNCWSPAISANGRYLGFNSDASNLVTDDANHYTQNVFVRDLQAGVTSCVSVNSQGHPSSTPTYPWLGAPSLSADGRFIAFRSNASDLVPGQICDDNYLQIFRRDMLTMTTILASPALAGGDSHGNAIYPTISSDGQRIAYGSQAPDLVANDDADALTPPTTLIYRAFLYDALANSVVCLSLTPDGHQAKIATEQIQLSADGQRAVFVSRVDLDPSIFGGGKAQVFIRNIAQGSTTMISRNHFGIASSHECYAPTLSADGNFVTFVCNDPTLAIGTPSLTDSSGNNFLMRNIDSGTIIFAGQYFRYDRYYYEGWFASPAAVSAHGASVAYVTCDHVGNSYYRGMVNSHVQVKDLASGKDEVASNGLEVGTDRSCQDGDTFQAESDNQGRRIAFLSDATNLTDPFGRRLAEVHVHDRISGQTTRIPSPDGTNCLSVAISGNGRWIAFVTETEKESTVEQAVYLYDGNQGKTFQIGTVALQHGGIQGHGYIAVDSEGNRVAFASTPWEVSLFTIATGVTSTISAPTGYCKNLALSGDGMYLVCRWRVYDGSDWKDRVYLHDLVGGQATDIGPVDMAGKNYLCSVPSLSSDGRFTVYFSFAPDLNPSCRTYIYDRLNACISLLPTSEEMIYPQHIYPQDPSISADGRYIAYAGIAPGHDWLDDLSVRLYDRQTGTVRATFPISYATQPRIIGDGSGILVLSSQSLSPEALTLPQRRRNGYVINLQPRSTN